MEKKDKLFNMRVTPTILDAIEQLAKRAGIDKTAYVSKLIRDDARRKRIITRSQQEYYDD